MSDDLHIVLKSRPTGYGVYEPEVDEEGNRSLADVAGLTHGLDVITWYVDRLGLTREEVIEHLQLPRLRAGLRQEDEPTGIFKRGLRAISGGGQ